MRGRPALFALALGVAAGPVAFAVPLGDEFALPKLAVGLTTAGALAATMDWRAAGRRSSMARVPLACAAALILALAMSTMLADSPRASLLGTYADYNGLLSYVPGLACFAAACVVVRTPAALDRFISIVATGAVPVLVYGWLQVAGLDPLDWDDAFEGRAFSTLGQPLVLGGFLCTLLPALAWLAWRRTGGERALIAAEAVAGLGLLVATGTRGAYLGAIAGIAVAVVLAMYWRGNWRLVLPAGAIAALAAALLVGGWQAGILPERLTFAPSVDERVDLWRAATGMAADRPLHGWGPDQFTYTYGRYRPSPLHGTQTAYELPAASPHNEALTILAGGGVLAVAAYMGLWLSSLTRAIRPVSKSRRAAACALLAATAAYAVQAQFSISDSAVNMLGLTCLGSLVGMTAHAAHRRPAVMSATRWLRAPGVICGTALCATAGLLVAADWMNARAEDSLARGERESLDGLRIARRLNPFQAEYDDDLADAHEASPGWGVRPADAYSAALSTRERRIERFGGEARHHLLAAEDAARVRPESRRLAVAHHLAEARRLDPKNPGLADAIAAIEAQIR